MDMSFFFKLYFYHLLWLVSGILIINIDMTCIIFQKLIIRPKLRIQNLLAIVTQILEHKIHTKHCFLSQIFLRNFHQSKSWIWGVNVEGSSHLLHDAIWFMMFCNVIKMWARWSWVNNCGNNLLCFRRTWGV